MRQPIVVDADVHKYPEVRHISNDTVQLCELTMTYLMRGMPWRCGCFLQVLASQVKEKPFHAWGARFRLEIGMPLLIDDPEAAFLVGILRRRIADENADLSDFKP